MESVAAPTLEPKVQPLSNEVGPSTKRERRTVAKQIEGSMYRLRRMTKDGERIYNESWSRWTWDKVITWSLKGTYALSRARAVVTRDKTPYESGPNTAINVQERTCGILGVGGPHSKDVFFKRNVIFMTGVNHRNDQEGLDDQGKIKKIERSMIEYNPKKGPDFLTSNHLSNKFLLQPVITSLTESSLRHFDSSQYPNYQPTVDEKGNRKLELGKLMEYTENQAVRLVFYDKQVGSYKFANIDKATYELLQNGKFDDNNPFLLTDILAGDISKSDLRLLTDRGIDIAISTTGLIKALHE